MAIKNLSKMLLLISLGVLILLSGFTILQQTLASGNQIATTTAVDATNGSRNLKLFIAAGRFWVVFSSGGAMVYSSSVDGVSWSSPTIIRYSVIHGSWFGVYSNGTHFAYVYAASTPIFFRLGRPQSDGSISWVAPEQSFAGGSSPAVSFDSNGYAWVGFFFNGYAWIIKDMNRDGTWVNDTSSPFNGTAIQLTTTVGSWSVFAQPMNSGRMYVFYGLTGNGFNGNGIKGRLLIAGSPVPAEEIVTSNALKFGEAYSSVSSQDNVYIVYTKASGVIAYEQRLFGGSWSTEEIIQTGNPSTTYPALALNTTSNRLVAFWANAPSNNILYYSTRCLITSCIWDPTPSILQDESADGNVVFPSAYWQDGVISGGHYLAVEYETNSTVLNTYKVKFAFLSWPPPQPSPPFNLKATGGIRNISLTWQPPVLSGRAPITNYRVYRGATSGGESGTPLIQLGNLTSYTDASVTGGTTYFYKVTALNSLGESSLSYEASATPTSAPQPPNNLQATPADSKITLTWSPPANNGNSPITSYKIYRGTTGGGESLLATFSNQTKFVNYFLVNGKTYYYKVTALNSIGESSPSNEISAIPGSSVNSLPPVPFILLLTSLLVTRIASKRSLSRPVAKIREQTYHSREP